MIIGIGDCALDGVPEMLFQRVTKKFEIWSARVASPVSFLLDANDIRRAPVARKKILPILCLKEVPECLHPADDQHEVVLAAQREHGIDQIVPRALPAQLNLQAIREERKKVERSLIERCVNQG